MFDIIDKFTKVRYTVVYVENSKSKNNIEEGVQYWAYNHNSKNFEWLKDNNRFELLTNKDIY